MESGVHSWGPSGAPSIFPFDTRVWRWPFKADQGLALREKKITRFLLSAYMPGLGREGGSLQPPLGALEGQVEPAALIAVT